MKNRMTEPSGIYDYEKMGHEAMAEVDRFDGLPSGRAIHEIIIHCSATPAGRDVRLEEIRRWHVQERGWSDVGYHFVVELDGRIRSGRPLTVAGAHCRGRNGCSAGICYVGGLDAGGHPSDTRTPAQRRALKWLVAMLRRRFGNIHVWGHCDFASKACPCFDAAAEYALE